MQRSSISTTKGDWTSTLNPASRLQLTERTGHLSKRKQSARGLEKKNLRKTILLKKSAASVTY